MYFFFDDNYSCAKRESGRDLKGYECIFLYGDYFEWFSVCCLNFKTHFNLASCKSRVSLIILCFKYTYSYIFIDCCKLLLTEISN